MVELAIGLGALLGGYLLRHLHQRDVLAIEREALVRAQESTERERSHITQERARMAADRRSELQRWEVERAALLNRIKPEAAQYPISEGAAPPAVPLDDDEEYWKVRQAELDAQLRALANGGTDATAEPT